MTVGLPEANARINLQQLEKTVTFDDLGLPACLFCYRVTHVNKIHIIY